MEKDQIKENYLTTLSIRDTMDITEAELAQLEEDPNVQRYKMLSTYYEENKCYKDKNDDILLDAIIESSEEIPELENTFFCMGKDFTGIPTRIGTYRLVANPEDHQNAIPVAVYRRMTGYSKSVILRLDEVEEFESEYNVLFPETENVSEEFLAARRSLYRKMIGLEQPEEAQNLAMRHN